MPAVELFQRIKHLPDSCKHSNKLLLKLNYHHQLLLAFQFTLAHIWAFSNVFLPTTPNLQIILNSLFQYLSLVFPEKCFCTAALSDLLEKQIEAAIRFFRPCFVPTHQVLTFLWLGTKFGLLPFSLYCQLKFLWLSFKTFSFCCLYFPPMNYRHFQKLQ